MESKIDSILARRIWDSRGYPTIEVEIILEDGTKGRGIAPSGASKGVKEALDLRDGTTSFFGKDVLKAIKKVDDIISKQLIGKDVLQQESIDRLLINLDNTENKRKLGGNTLIAISLAAANAASNFLKVPLWKYLRGEDKTPILMPVPEVQIFGGGVHAQGRTDVQDFMIIPYGAESFSEAMEWVAEIYMTTGNLLQEMSKRYGVADEGGYWPAFDTTEEILEVLIRGIEKSGFNTENQIGISLDIAASQIYKDGIYSIEKNNQELTKEEWLIKIISWVDNFPIISIEDPFEESDFDSFSILLNEVGSQIQIVGDDLLVTNKQLIHRAMDLNACNTLLCKPNQIGTLLEAKEALLMAKEMKWDTIVSARSGESEDTSLVHLAIGWGASQIKVGAFSRSERMAKWNEVIRIEESLGNKSRFASLNNFGKRK